MKRTETEHATSAHDEPPVRWLSAPARGEGPAARLADLIRAGGPPGGFDPAGRARVWARLTQARRIFPWRGLTGLRWVLAVVVLLTSGVVIGAVTAHRFWPQVVPEDAPASEAATARRRAKSTGRSRRQIEPAAGAPANETAGEGAAHEPAPPPALSASAPASPAAPGAPRPEAAPPDGPAITAAPARAPEPAPVRSPGSGSAARFVARPAVVAMAAPSTVPAPATPPALTPPPAPTQSALGAETELLQEAVSRLRRHGDAAQALAALDLYDERFPRGTLRREADGARVDALLLLGRDDEALSVLRTLTLRPQERDQELQVIRGELLAPGRCTRAIADFDAVLAAAPPARLAERALYGRAACRLHQEDSAGAARDLQDYLRRFPRGQFAAEARRVLRER